jgi:hypothetical protein
MKNYKLKIGSIKVNLPDENQKYFSIFEDLAELFGKGFQSEAVKLLRSKLKDVKPKASIDYESDYTHISTSNVDTILSVINAIEELTIGEPKKSFEQVDKAYLIETFSNAKKFRPKPKEWQTGDVFSIPLLDKTFSLGQVLDKKYCTCVLFNVQIGNISLYKIDFRDLQAISILHLSNGDLLNNGRWQVLYNMPVTLNPSSGSGGRFGDIGSISYGGCTKLEDLANAYWGIIPWNVMYDETYYDEMLLKGIERPQTALVLNLADRKKFRKDRFGIE